jgi:uncharacterized protein YlaI
VTEKNSYTFTITIHNTVDEAHARKIASKHKRPSDFILVEENNVAVCKNCGKEKLVTELDFETETCFRCRHSKLSAENTGTPGKKEKKKPFDMYVCPECESRLDWVDDNKAKCRNCGFVYYKDETVYDDPVEGFVCNECKKEITQDDLEKQDHLCKECYEKKPYKCRICGEVLSKEDYIQGKGHCELCYLINNIDELPDEKINMISGKQYADELYNCVKCGSATRNIHNPKQQKDTGVSMCSHCVAKRIKWLESNKFRLLNHELDELEYIHEKCKQVVIQ